MDYIAWNKVKIEHTKTLEVENYYNKGFVFVRKAPNQLEQTRSLRIDLSNFTLNSENKRIIKKFSNFDITNITLPIELKNYDWNIHKMGKMFYKEKFDNVKFSAVKIKQLLTTNNSFNILLVYKVSDNIAGYCICYQGKNILHYAYPFYEFNKHPKNLGMMMMINSILYAQNKNLKYIYLGSVKNKSDLYKLQFKSIEWFDGFKWHSDLTKLKSIFN